MSALLQPILMPVKGAPDIVLSIDPNSPEELFVFLGMAMLKKVPRLQEHLAPIAEKDAAEATVDRQGWGQG